MRESLYGWYPSAESIYKRKSQYPDSYEQECTFRHHNSTYAKAGGSVLTPEPPHSIKIELAKRPGVSRNASRSSYKSTSSVSERIPSTQAIGQKQLDVPLHTDIEDASHHEGMSTTSTPAPSLPPSRPASGKYPAKPGSRPESATSRSSHYSNQSRCSKPWALKTYPTSRSNERCNSACVPGSPTRKPRIQSATTARSVRRTTPARRIKSAGPSRTYESSEDTVSLPLKSPSREFPKRCKNSNDQHRPRAPVPPSRDNLRQLSLDREPEQEPMDYDEQLRRHGWRMQVHGDPLGLKQPCIPKRRPFAVSIVEHSPRPAPPRGHMMNYETYFYNTIPKKPRSYTIHQEWVSEVLHAKRMALQARDGPKYQYAAKNYSFLY